MKIWTEDPLALLPTGADRDIVVDGAIPGFDLVALPRRHAALAQASVAD